MSLGKAACAMVDALSDELSLADALVITKHASFLTFEHVTVIEGDHPVPGSASLKAGNAAIKFLSFSWKKNNQRCGNNQTPDTRK